MSLLKELRAAHSWKRLSIDWDELDEFYRAMEAQVDMAKLQRSRSYGRKLVALLEADIEKNRIEADSYQGNFRAEHNEELKSAAVAFEACGRRDTDSYLLAVSKSFGIEKREDRLYDLRIKHEAAVSVTARLLTLNADGKARFILAEELKESRWKARLDFRKYELAAEHRLRDAVSFGIQTEHIDSFLNGHYEPSMRNA